MCTKHPRERGLNIGAIWICSIGDKNKFKFRRKSLMFVFQECCSENMEKSERNNRDRFKKSFGSIFDLCILVPPIQIFALNFWQLPAKLENLIQNETKKVETATYFLANEMFKSKLFFSYFTYHAFKMFDCTFYSSFLSRSCFFWKPPDSWELQVQRTILLVFF